ncbi:MAG TPA: hypothetical protein VMD29_11785 [Terracidiphilus sp.]|nr:hypothetical protein [Terracidiphilus sp.]
MGIVRMVEAIVARLLAEEIKGFLPLLSKKALNRAVRWLPTEVQARYREQWTADLLDMPGAISGLIFSVGLIRGAIRMRLNEETLAAFVKRRLLWKAGFIDFDVVGWERLTEEPERVTGTCTLVVRRLSIKEWLQRRRHGKDHSFLNPMIPAIQRLQERHAGEPGKFGFEMELTPVELNPTQVNPDESQPQ